jgi:hypothetical protein
MDLLVEAELSRAAGQPGCPLCRIGEEAAVRYLQRRALLRFSGSLSATWR